MDDKQTGLEEQTAGCTISLP